MGEELQGDPFDMDCSLTQAVEKVATTSLWELKLLRRHRIPAVATLMKLFFTPFFKPTAKKLDPELFLDQSAATVYKQLLKAGDRQVVKLKSKGKNVPLAFDVKDESAAMKIIGWAATLSTTQRKVGTHM